MPLVLDPSWLWTIEGRPVSSIVATAENVVPKSIPMNAAIVCFRLFFGSVDADLRGQDDVGAFRGPQLPSFSGTNMWGLASRIRRQR